jgi:hypothetical protein
MGITPSTVVRRAAGLAAVRVRCQRVVAVRDPTVEHSLTAVEHSLTAIGVRKACGGRHRREPESTAGTGTIRQRYGSQRRGGTAGPQVHLRMMIEYDDLTGTRCCASATMSPAHI